MEEEGKDTGVANEEENGYEKLFIENTTLYTKMSMVCHLLMFLFSTAFWIQVGVYPVSYTMTVVYRDGQ